MDRNDCDRSVRVSLIKAEHTEDDDDDDFNPNEFIDDLLDLNKDEIGNGIISKREARELQYDAYDMLFPQVWLCTLNPYP